MSSQELFRDPVVGLAPPVREVLRQPPRVTFSTSGLTRKGNN